MERATGIPGKAIASTAPDAFQGAGATRAPEALEPCGPRAARCPKTFPGFLGTRAARCPGTFHGPLVLRPLLSHAQPTATFQALNAASNCDV